MKCEHCGYVMNEKINFCPSCGNAVQEEKIEVTYCGNCGGQLLPKEKYCHVCGTKRYESTKGHSTSDEVENTIPTGATTDSCETNDNEESEQEEVILVVEDVDTNNSQEGIETTGYIPIGKSRHQSQYSGVNQVKTEYRQVVGAKNTGKNYFKNPILWIVSISLLVICLLLSQYMAGVYQTYEDDTTDEVIQEENDVDLSDFAITGTNSLFANQTNIHYGGVTYLYKEVLYFCSDEGVVAYSADFKTEEVILEETASYIYVDDTYLYYCDSNSDYYRMNLESGEIESLLENIYYPQHINNHLYYQKDSDNESVYVYDIETKEDKKLNDVISYSIFVEEEENRIFYTNEESQLCIMDVDGQNNEILIDTVVYSFVVDGGTVYYTGYTGINSYILETKENTLLQRGYAYNINIIEDRLVYIVSEDGIYIMDKTGDKKSKLLSNSNDSVGLFIVGDKIIYESYDITNFEMCYEILDMSGNSEVFYEYLDEGYYDDYYGDYYYDDYDNNPSEGFDF